MPPTFRRARALQVAHAWDRTPLLPHEITTFELGLGLTRLPSVDLDDEVSVPELRIAFEAPLFGDPPPPPSNASRRAYDGLWHHEVVELFIASDPCRPSPDRPAYVELEFGPYGHALGLSFSDIRRRIEIFDVPGESHRRAGRWTGQARVPLALLPAMPWRVGAFAIHGPPTARRYLAAVPSPNGTTPDFHDPALWPPFAIEWRES